MRAPTVSVVLIFFDDERFLADAVDSVLAQSFTDWELILVDDGSADGSTAIAKRYASADPERISYVDHPGHANRGISATRNLGIGRARGRYIAFLDSDDVWEPCKLAEQTTLLRAHPEVGLLFGSSLYWYSWATTPGTRADRLMPIGSARDAVVAPPALVTTLYPLGSGIPPCPSSCIARRDVVERVGGFEEHMPGLYDDQGFLAKVYLDTPVYVSSECWDRYRRHPGAVTMSSSSAEYSSARRHFLAWYEHHLEIRGVDAPDIRAALDRAWWPYHHPHLAAARRTTGRALARARRTLARR